MMDCPLGLDKVHCSSCCFWRDKCHCDPLPKPLARFLDGFFTSIREGKHSHEDVSSVLFYRFKWLENTHVHLAYAYHNPFALRPLNPDLLSGVPQMVPDEDGKMKWLHGEPE